jgi:hypothetical protein
VGDVERGPAPKTKHFPSSQHASRTRARIRRQFPPARRVHLHPAQPRRGACSPRPLRTTHTHTGRKMPSARVILLAVCLLGGTGTEDLRLLLAPRHLPSSSRAGAHWPSSRASILLASAAAASSALLVPLEEGFHHDVDDNTVTVGDSHACAIERMDSTDIGGEAVCWGEGASGETDSPAVSGALGEERGRWGGGRTRSLTLGSRTHATSPPFSLSSLPPYRAGHLRSAERRGPPHVRNSPRRVPRLLGRGQSAPSPATGTGTGAGEEPLPPGLERDGCGLRCGPRWDAAVLGAQQPRGGLPSPRLLRPGQLRHGPVLRA